MRIWLFALAATLLGIGIGVSTAYREIVLVPRQFLPHNQTLTTSWDGILEEATDEPRVVVEDGPSYDFGSGQRQAHMTHTFQIRNEGAAPLTLEKGSTSCKCTLSELEKGELQPGESCKIKLEWTLSTEGSGFRQTAEIHTNDPRHSTLILDVHGKVVDTLKLEPEDLVLSDVSVSDGKTAEFSILGYGVEDLEIVNHSFKYAESAPFFDLKFEPGEIHEHGDEPNPTSVLRGILTAKSGLPLGPIVQTIQMKTNVAEAAELELSITGQVVSDISVVGANFRQSHNLLSLGALSPEKGAEAVLRILVKGPYRENVELKIKEVDPPDVLKASLGEAQLINNGAVYMYPLTITIPKGVRSITRMGVTGTDYGRIEIETTHPSAKILPLKVRFAVQ